MGASSGIILTKEALARLRVKKGDTLFLPEAPAGGHRLTPYNPNFARQMALAEECIVSAKPTGIHARRTWFLYEWLTGRTLDVPEFLASMKYVTVMEPNKYLTGKGTRSPRHHVINNLPGTPDFCPIVARTPLLDWYAGMEQRRSCCSRTRRRATSSKARIRPKVASSDGAVPLARQASTRLTRMNSCVSKGS